MRVQAFLKACCCCTPSCVFVVVSLKGGSPLHSTVFGGEHKRRPRGGCASSLAPGRAEAPATHARNRTKSGRPLPHEHSHKLKVLRRRASLCAPETRGVATRARVDVPALIPALTPASVPRGWQWRRRRRRLLQSRGGMRMRTVRWRKSSSTTRHSGPVHSAPLADASAASFIEAGRADGRRWQFLAAI